MSYTDKNDFLNKARHGIGHKAIAGDDLRGDALQAMLQDAFQNMVSHTRAGGCFYVAYADINAVAFRHAMTAAGVKISQGLVWIKNSAVLSRNDYNWKHEPILYGWKEGAAHYFAQDFTQTTVIDSEQDPAKMSKDDLVAEVTNLRKIIQTTIARENRPR